MLQQLIDGFDVGVGQLIAWFASLVSSPVFPHCPYLGGLALQPCLCYLIRCSLQQGAGSAALSSSDPGHPPSHQQDQIYYFAQVRCMPPSSDGCREHPRGAAECQLSCSYARRAAPQ